jgi:hypothetical protein
MLVRQLVGPLAGKIVELDYAIGTACLAVGTACLPDDTPKIRGMNPAQREVAVHRMPNIPAPQKKRGRSPKFTKE